MSVSGIEVSPEAMTAFNSIKEKGTKKGLSLKLKGIQWSLLNLVRDVILKQERKTRKYLMKK